MDAASTNELLAAKKREREQREAEVALERGVVGIGDGSLRTWHGGPPVNEHMWVRVGAGFEADGVTPTRPHLARNPSLHEFAEGDPVTLEWMHSGRGANMLQIVYRESLNLFGLFVECWTHPRRQTPETWKILRFTTLPSPTYTDLGYPGAGSVGGHQRFMAVSQAGLFYGGSAMYRYTTTGGWTGVYAFTLGPFDGKRFWVKHNGRVYGAWKTANNTVTIYLLNNDATSEQVGEFSDGSITDDEIVYASSLTPEAPGLIYFQLGVDEGEGAGSFRILTWDAAAPTAFATLSTSPTYIGEGPLSFLEVRNGVHYAIGTDVTGIEPINQRLHSSAGDATWGELSNLTAYRDTMSEEPFNYGRHRPSQDVGSFAHYDVDVDGALWLTQADFDTDWGSGGTAGNSWRQAPIHYGGTPLISTGDPQADDDGEMTFFIRHTAAGQELIVSTFDDLNNPDTVARALSGGLRIGGRVYVGLGLSSSFSSEDITFPTDPPGGLFVYDIAQQTWTRFLDVSDLTELGGVGMMLAHNVTEAAAV